MNAEQLLGAISDNRAIDSFDSHRKISESNWQTLLTVAQNAPSSNGLEPWHIIEIDDTKLREKLIPHSPGMAEKLKSADKFIFFATQTFDDAAFRHIKQDIHHWPEENYQGFRKRFEILQTELLEIDFTAWQERQTAIPFGQMLLAAALLGIDVTPMEGFFAGKVAEILAEEGLLDLKTERLTTAAAFGYRLESPEHPRNRRPLSEIVRKK